MAIFSLPDRAAAVRPGRPVRHDRRQGGRRGHGRSNCATRWLAILPPGVEAVTAASASASEARQLNSQLGVLTTFFVAFAGVALFVGAFVIWNTFSIMIGQRARQLALLRALGAGRGQVFRSVLAEAAVVGTAGAHRRRGARHRSWPRASPRCCRRSACRCRSPGWSVPPVQVALACAVGLVVTLVAALAPAYRATRVAPVQALRDAAPSPAGFSAARLAAAWRSPARASPCCSPDCSPGPPSRSPPRVPGCRFIGVTVLGPLLARPLACGWWGSPLTRLPARVGTLARGNTMRNPKRTSATAAALMIGLAVITAVSVLVSSARAMIGGQVSAAGRTSFYVQATNTDVGLTPALATVLARQPGVQAVTEVRTTDATVAGATHRASMALTRPGSACSPTSGSVPGRLDALNSGELLVSAAAAGRTTGDR